MLTKQFDYLRKAAELFTAYEFTGFLKIILGQTQTKMDLQYINIKFNNDENLDVKCACGLSDTVMHRLFNCSLVKSKCDLLKLKIGERWKLISHPVDLVLMCGDIGDLICVIKNVLLHSNGVGLLKYKYYNIITDEVLKIQKQKLLILQRDLI